MKKSNIKKKLQILVDWPPKEYPRRDDGGFPLEISYDEYSYKRIVSFYRNEIQKIIDEI
jgi:hypothetical protein